MELILEYLQKSGRPKPPKTSWPDNVFNYTHKEHFWKTKENIPIHPKDMTNKHLYYTIRLIERNQSSTLLYYSHKMYQFVNFGTIYKYQWQMKALHRRGINTPKKVMAAYRRLWETETIYMIIHQELIKRGITLTNPHDGGINLE